MRPEDQLLSYTRIHLEKMSHFLPSEGLIIFDNMRAVASKTGNTPVELFGNVPPHITAIAFATFFTTATEIIYREHDHEKAVILSSILDSDYIRPSSVIPFNAWNSTIVEKIKHTAGELTIDLEKLWKNAGETQPNHQLTAFLTSVHEYVPDPDRVKLIGEIPVLPTLMTMAWFALYAKEIEYQDFLVLENHAYAAR